MIFQMNASGTFQDHWFIWHFYLIIDFGYRLGGNKDL